MWVQYSDFRAKLVYPQDSMTHGGVSLMHILGVVETTQVRVVMGKHVSSSVGKRVTSWKSALRVGRVVEILAIKPCRLQFLHQKEFHLVLLVSAEEQIACMLSIVSKRKRNHYMLLIVWSVFDFSIDGLVDLEVSLNFFMPLCSYEFLCYSWTT